MSDGISYQLGFMKAKQSTYTIIDYTCLCLT